MNQKYLVQFVLKFCCSWSKKTRQQDASADANCKVLEFLAVVKSNSPLCIPEVCDCLVQCLFIILCFPTNSLLNIVEFSIRFVRDVEYLCFVQYCMQMPPVLCHCCLGSRNGIQPVKKLSGGILAWLYVWGELQICIWPS